MHDDTAPPPLSRTTTPQLEAQRRTSEMVTDDDDSTYGNAHPKGPTDDASSQHIRMASPVRPRLPKRNTLRGASAAKLQEALRLARAREEQETLLGEHEEADDDGCYPPRKNSDPTVPNPHAALPVYTTIHKIRRLIVASLGGYNTSGMGC